MIQDSYARPDLYTMQLFGTTWKVLGKTKSKDMDILVQKKKMLEIHAVLSLRAFLKYELSDNSMDMCIKSKSLIRITLLSKYLAER